MNTQHTAGQWKHRKTINQLCDFEIYNSSENTTLALVTNLNKTGSAEANAKLIAAAPELLRALNNMVNISYDTARPSKADRDYNIDMAIAAIKKATL